MAFNIVAGVNNAVYGSVSGSGSYEENAEVTLEVTVNDGYRFVQWDDGNTDNPRVFNATEDVTLVATLEAIPEYAVTVTANNDNLGSVSGSGNYQEATSATISATPALHCRFVKWDDDNTDNPRTITVNSAITLQAIFETVNWYSITATSADDTMGSVTGSGDYDEGDTVTLTAVPETDYKFVEWSDGDVSNPRTFTASQSLSLSATFAAIIYSDVTIASNDNELGTVSGAISGNIETGSSITLTATPATDCRFDGWQVDGEMLSDTSSTITLTVAETEMDIIAVFSAIVFYQVNLLSSDTDCGYINVVSQTAEPRGTNNNIWPEGTVLELAAVEASGGRFLNWGDGSLSLSKTITVYNNQTVRANFYPASGLILVTKKILQHTWGTIKSFFSASTGASNIGVPDNNALGATTLADVVNSVGQANGLAQLNEDGKIDISDLGGSSNEGLAVDITGNAATATSATNADVATKLGTTTVGATDTPIYLNAGTATACGGSLAVDITGNAATATTASKLGNTTAVGNVSNPVYFNANGVPTLCNNFASASIAASDSTTTPAGWFRIFSLNNGYENGLIIVGGGGWGAQAPCSAILSFSLINARPNISLIASGNVNVGAGASTTKIRITCGNDGRYVEAYNNSTAQNRNQFFRILTNVAGAVGYNIAAGSTPNGAELSYTATVDINKNTEPCLHTTDSAVGSASVPVYIDADGSAQVCTSVNLNATSATTSAACSGNAATASVASKVTYTQTTYNGNRPLAISYVEGITNTANFNNAILFSNKVYFHPTNGTLTSTGTSGTSSVDGKAAFESALTSATYKSAYNGGVIINSTAAKGFTMLTRMKSTNGKFMHGVYNADYQFYYVADTVTTNAVTKTCLTINESGTVSAPNGFVGNLTGDCSGSSGSCTGNAATATSATKATMTAATAATWYSLVATTYNATSGTAYGMVRLNNANSRPDAGLYYDANATSGNQRVILNLGNATANTTAAGKNGMIQLWGTGTTSTCIVAGNPSSGNTVTLPTGTGTLALTSSDITGNAATATTATSATTASSCSGTSTYATNAKLTHTVGNTEYPLVFGSSFKIDDSQQGLKIGTPTATAANCPLRCKAYCAAADTQGEAYIIIGNNLATTAANNARGSLYMYGTGATYVRFIMGTTNTSSRNITINSNLTDNRTYTLPNGSGTLAFTSSNITGSASKWGGYALSVVTALPSTIDANTIYLVK